MIYMVGELNEGSSSGKSRYHCGLQQKRNSLSPMEARAKTVKAFYSTVYFTGIGSVMDKNRTEMPFFVP